MAVNKVDAALASPPEQMRELLLAIQEDQWFERKSAMTKLPTLAKALVAMANAEGGVIVVGIADKVIEGIDALSNIQRNDLRQAVLNQVQPPIRAQIEEVSCQAELGEVKTLFVIRVEPSERVHETNDGTCYLRSGDESIRLNFQQRTELLHDKGLTHYEAEPIDGVEFSDLDLKLIDSYRSKISATQETESLLRNRGLVTKKREVTVGGYLLFGRHPQDLLPQAHIRIVKFLSDERGTGSRLNVDSENDYRVDGPIPRAIMQAQKIIEDIVPKRRHLAATGLFETQPVIPRDAWLEGLVNAAIHRSYSLAGDHIRIELYPSRIEIHSPGRFPGIANLSDPLRIDRFARNPRIARVCSDLSIGQELGEGIKRMFDEMRGFGLTDPMYVQKQASVTLTLQAVNRIPEAVVRRMPPRTEQVLFALRSLGGTSSTGDIAIQLGWTKPTVISRLNALRSEGLIEWVGKSPRDPRAVWRVQT